MSAVTRRRGTGFRQSLSGIKKDASGFVKPNGRAAVKGNHAVNKTKAGNSGSFGKIKQGTRNGTLGTINTNPSGF